jgi:hypothetical protein
MEWGIPKLTQKGRDAVKNMPPELTARCRNILVQVDGNRSLDDIRAALKGLDGIEEAIAKLTAGTYIEVSRECLDMVKAMAEQMLGPKAPTLIKKIEELHAKHGDACWDHVEELDKTARLFYGAVVADKLKTEIARLLREAKK